MGFFDKVKEQAEKAKVQAQDLKEKVGDKVDEVQAKRKADDLLEDLGRLVYAKHTDRALANTETEMPRLVAALKALEDDGVPILQAPPVAEPAPVVASGAEAAPAPTEEPAPMAAAAPEAAVAPMAPVPEASASPEAPAQGS
jgi:hypothetical protein